MVDRTNISQVTHKQQTKLTSNSQATCHHLCAIGGYSPTDLIHS
nr:MAG TPA: hypothetical protein [Caudoviricetes sp.]DAG41799.1 MAG TPA: hypothetical protein [Caudoviricetes sp.]DAJ58578.1 MAG TPA: hypothetical protein [Caudoviricetes sp.]